MTQIIDFPLFLIIRFLIALLAIIGNIFIIATIQRYPALRSKSYNGLICLLAFSDFIVGVGLLIRTIGTIIHAVDGETDYTVMHCISLGATNVFGIHLSQLSMLCIAFDRLYAIISPIGYKQRDPVRYPLKCLLFCSIFAVNGLLFLFFGVDRNRVAPVCNLGAVDPNGVFVKYWTTFFSLVSMLLFGAYGSTLYFVYRGFAKSFKGEFEREYARQRKVFLSISIVLLSNFLCMVIPLMVTIFGAVIKASPEFFSITVLVTGFLSAVNASNNIFIYGWKYEQLRMYMGHMMHCRSASDLRRETSFFFLNPKTDVTGSLPPPS